MAIAVAVSIAAHVFVAWLLSGRPEGAAGVRTKPQKISLVTLKRGTTTPVEEEPPPPQQTVAAPTPLVETAVPQEQTRTPSDRVAGQQRGSTSPLGIPDSGSSNRRLPGGIANRPNDLAFPSFPSTDNGSQKALDRLSGLGTTAPTDAPNSNGSKASKNADLLTGKATEKAAKTYAKPDFNIDGAIPPENANQSATDRAERALVAMNSERNETQASKRLRPSPPALAAVEKQAPQSFTPSADAVAGSVKKCKTCEHEIGRLTCLVDVSLSTGDATPAVAISQSSGDPTFDAAALDAVKAALPNSATGFAWSRFRFSAEVYHFSAMEMLLDPGFKPPGRRLASKGSGANSMTTSVRLVDFR